jgi:hypothetical protein
MSIAIPRNTAVAGQRTVPFYVGTAANPLAPATSGVVGLQPHISFGGAAFAPTTATVVAVNAATGDYAVVLTTGEVSAYGPFRLRLDDAAIAPVREGGVVGGAAIYSEPETNDAIATAVVSALASTFATLNAAIAAVPNATANATAVWNAVLATGHSAANLMRGFAATLMGKSTVAGGTSTFRNLEDTKDAIVSTASAGTRSTVTRDLTAVE